MRSTLLFLAILPFLWAFNSNFEKADNTLSNSNDTLFWQESYSIQRTDFIGRNDNTSGFAAYSFTMVILDYSIAINRWGVKEPSFNIRAGFDKQKSWISDESLREPDIVLMHERLHFDITELTARRLKMALSITYKQQTMQEQINQIYQKQIRLGDEMQERYDKETDHGLNRTKQVAWETKIARKLQELK